MFLLFLSTSFLFLPSFYVVAGLIDEMQRPIDAMQRSRSLSNPVGKPDIGIPDVGAEEKPERPRRNSFSVESSSRQLSLEEPQFRLLEDGSGWSHVISMRKAARPSYEHRGWVVLPEDAHQPLLSCRISYQPGPGERIFDEDPSQERGRPYFSYGGILSSTVLTPLNLLVYSDPGTLGQTGGEPQRAVGPLKLLLVALYALDDLEETRPVTERVYRLAQDQIKDLGERLFTTMLSQERKSLTDLEEMTTLASIARRTALNILAKIGYSERAITNLIRLADELQTRRREADTIPSSYEDLEKID